MKKGKIARWMTELAEYDFKVIHKLSGQMVHVDFLSRYLEVPEDIPDRMVLTVGSLDTEVRIPTFEEVVEEQQKNEDILPKG